MPAFFMRAWPFIAFSVLMCTMAAGQAPVSCGADLFHRRNLAQETYQQSEALLEQSAYAHFKEPIAQRGHAVVEVPVVVHLIHNNGPENIADVRVQQAIQWLNDAFAHTGAFAQGSGVEVPIRFCLARRQPDGSATNGITRTVSPLTKLQAEPEDAALKDLVRWNPLEYLNIWVVNDICSDAYGCGITAYAYRPGSHGSDQDGVVIEAAWMGEDLGYAGILAHEVGHYLGLYHTFEGGCQNADCLLDGDRVCDTPPDQSSAAIPCDQTVNTCSTDALSGFSSDQFDLTRNFMDYGDTRCQRDFSQGQSDRMRFFLEGARSSLLQSKACQPPCTAPVTAVFAPGDTTILAGTTLALVNKSQNSGAVRWLLNGSPLTNPVYTFSTPGLYTVTLIAEAQDAERCASASVGAVIQVVCPAQASFSLSAQYVAVGETVTIQNNTQHATQQEWFINNVSQGAQLSQFTPPALGSYLIRLETVGAGCRSEQSQYVIVRDSCSAEQFVKRYSWERNERGLAVLALPDGSAIMCGDAKASGKASMFLIKTAPDGAVIWARASNEALSAAFTPQDIVATPDGGVVVALSVVSGGQNLAVVKYDADGRFVWGYQLDKPGTDEVANAICALPGGGYAVCGTANSAGTGWTPFVMVLNESGVLQWVRAYDAVGQYFAGDITANAARLFLSCNRTAGGQNTAAVLSLDLQTGAVLWNKRIGSAIGNQSAAIRLLPNGLLAVAGQNLGNSAVQRMPWIALLQTSDGSLFEARSLPDRPGGNRLLVKDLLYHPNGEIWLGATEEGSNNTCLLHLKSNLLDGQMFWYDGSMRVLNRMALLPNGGCLMTGNWPTESSIVTDPCLIRTDASGFAGLCSSPAMAFSSMSSDLAGSDLAFSTVDLPALQALALPLQTFSPEVHPTCGLQPCRPASSQDCDRSSWNYNYKLVPRIPTNQVVTLSPTLAQLSSGDYIVVEQLSGMSQLSRIDKKGRIVWAREVGVLGSNVALKDVIRPLPNDEFLMLSEISNWVHFDGNGNVLRIWNVALNLPAQPTIDKAIVTRDKDLVCAGSTLSQVNGYLFFVFRISPGGQVLWSNVMNFPSNAFVISMFELPGGDIIIQHNSGYTTCVGADGQLKWSKLLTVQTATVSPHFIRQHTNSDIYIAGHAALIASDVYPALMQLDQKGNLKRVVRYDMPGYFTGLTQAPDGNLLATYALASNRDGGSVVKININDLSARMYTYELKMYDVQTSADQTPIYVGSPLTDSSNPVFSLSKADTSGLPKLCQVITSDLSVVNMVWDETPVTPGFDSHSIEIIDLDLPTNNPLITETQTICPGECDGLEEICDNLIDDDGDFLIDCADEDCPCSEDACATRRANLWYFGQQWGLDFSSDPPQFVGDGRTYTTGNTAVAADPNGHLVAYAGGDVLYDRFHHPFEGTNKMPVLLPAGEVLMVPSPGSNRYFDYFRKGESGSLQQYTIDPQANEGLGGVEIQGDLWGFWGGQMCALKACTGNAYWLAGGLLDVGGTYYLGDVLVGQGTTASPFLIPVPSAVFELKAAPNSKWIATLDAAGQLRLYGFNATNGAFSPGIDLNLPPALTRFYANLEFSPDSRFLYVSASDSVGQTVKLIQYDLLAGTPAQINATAAIAGSFDNTLPMSMQLGPDHKIYVACRAIKPAAVGINHWLSVIHQPNRSGTAVLLQNKAIPLPNPYEPAAEFRLPNFPAYYFKTPMVRFRQPSADTVCQSGRNILYHVAHNECSDANIQWRVEGLSADIAPMGDTAMVRYREAGSGRLIVTQTTPCGTVADTLPILVLDVAPPPLNLGPDRVLCDKGVVVLDAGPGFASYRWQDGTTEQRLTTLLPGQYAVTVTDACGQSQSDTIRISFAAPAGLQLGADRRLCPGDTLSFTRPAAINTWRWSPADFLNCADCSRITVAPTKNTTYITTGQTADGCVVVDTLSIEVLQASNVRLDTTICPGTTLRYQGETLSAGQERRFTLVGFNGCDSVVVVRVDAFPALSVALPADTVLFYGDTLALNAQITGIAPFDWQWSPQEGLSCTDCTNPLAFPLADVVYTIQVTDDNGCSAADSIQIAVNTQCDPIVPNAFTPNGDELNDWFYPITYPCTRQMLSWRIYNRWGQLMFERLNFKSNNPSLGWDGRKEQVAQPMDVYVWYAEWLRLDGKKESAKGSFTLLR